MSHFPFVPMEVVERSQYDGGTYFLIQTVEDRNGWEVAEVRPDIPYQLRTAKLLAAAPELLDALEMCTKAMSSALPDFRPYDQTAYDKARAAIAKARGES